MEVIIGCETFMLVLMILVLVILICNKQFGRERDKLFMAFLCCGIFALFCDLYGCHNLGNQAASPNTLKWMIWCAYFFGTMQMCLFMYYVVAFVGERKSVNRWFVHIPMIFIGLDVIMDLVGIFTGSFYLIADGRLKVGIWYYPSMMIKVVGTFYLLVYVCVMALYMDTTERYALITFATIPALSVMVQLIDENISFVCTGGALGTFMAFMFLQSKTAGDSLIKERVMFELSHVDTLTGLCNRIACEDSINHLKEESLGRVGVIYTDLNNLKNTNDNFGHDAGDELIISYSKLLKRVFGNSADDEQANIRKIFGKEKKKVGLDLLDCIYRISGDEFVSIIPDTRLSEESSDEAQKKFVILVESLREVIAENNDVAAVGCSFGPSKEVERLLSESERKMYQDKAIIYKKLGLERRKY